MFPFTSSDERGPSLWRDLREGRAGVIPRLGLSLCLGVAIFAAGVLLAAVLDEFADLDEAHIAVIVAVGGVLWCAGLLWLWAGMRRVGHIVRSVVIVIGVWVVVAALSALAAEATRNEEAFITAFVFLGIAATLTIGTFTVYGMMRGKPVQLPTGTVNVSCPGCGYSLVGLHEPVCPECGSRFTIDELIRLQNYEGARVAMRMGTDKGMKLNTESHLALRHDEPPATSAS